MSTRRRCVPTQPCPTCQAQPAHSLTWWAALIALGAVLEGAALRHHHREHTLTHALRSVFRTESTTGQRAFAGGWVALSCWLIPHVLNGPDTRGSR